MNIKEKAVVGFLAFINIVMLTILISQSNHWFISSLNLVFHEAGHVFFMLFGPMLHTLGGTIGELSIPIMFIIYFSMKQDYPGKIFSYWWLSTALYNIAVYVGDARAQVLPLVGGPGGHDWFYLLSRFNLLRYDTLFSNIIIILAWIALATSILMLYRYIRSFKGRIIS